MKNSKFMLVYTITLVCDGLSGWLLLRKVIMSRVPNCPASGVTYDVLCSEC